MTLPTELVILGKRYVVQYFDKPSEVDMYGRVSLWGQVDYWTRQIRIYKSDRVVGDIWETLLHEIIHAITSELNITEIKDKDDPTSLLDPSLPV